LEGVSSGVGDWEAVLGKASVESGRGRWWRIWVEGGSLVGHGSGSGSSIVAPLRHAGAASAPSPLIGDSSRVLDGEVPVLGKARGGSEGYGVVANFGRGQQLSWG